MCHWYLLAAKAGNSILSCMRKSSANRSRKVILSLHSVLWRSHLKFQVYFWASQYKRNMDTPERVQQSTRRCLRDCMEHL